MKSMHTNINLKCSYTIKLKVCTERHDQGNIQVKTLDSESDYNADPPKSTRVFYKNQRPCVNGIDNMDTRPTMPEKLLVFDLSISTLEMLLWASLQIVSHTNGPRAPPCPFPTYSIPQKPSSMASLIGKTCKSVFQEKLCFSDKKRVFRRKETAFHCIGSVVQENPYFPTKNSVSRSGKLF